ncbi:M56 family metallopeptidase [Micrococcoides hystricis]|uniref:M56 family metallopeptidase n=1 Tax=Micrococcoides hystricis TaxID=1572761 RepID=A0ABV6P720_9MICC
MWAHPFAAMVIWQTVAVAGVFSLLGAPIAAALAPLGNTVPQAVSHILRSDSPLGTVMALPTVHVTMLVIAAVLAGHLLLTFIVTVVRLQREVNEHKNLVKLLGSEGSAKHTYVLPADQPVAYCLPGLWQPLTVVSSGLQDKLSQEQLDAVLTHERAHIRQNHHLLLAAFLTWRQALPWLPVTEKAQSAVSNLVEILADRATLEKFDRSVLLTAVVATYPLTPQEPADTFVPTSQTAQEQTQLSPRVATLINDPATSGTVAATMIASATAVLLGVMGLLSFGPL